MSDAETVYTSVRGSCNESEVVVYLNIDKVGSSDSLFHTPVVMGGTVKLGGMLDSGSMAGSISETAEMRLREAGVLTDRLLMDVNVVLVGCGVLHVKPKCAFEVGMEVYGCKMLVPTLVVPGQHDDLILGTKVIKHVLHQSKLCESYWKTVSGSCPTRDPETEHFLSGVKMFLTRLEQSGVTLLPTLGLVVNTSSGENCPRTLLFPQVALSWEVLRRPAQLPGVFWLQRL